MATDVAPVDSVDAAFVVIVRACVDDGKGDVLLLVVEAWLVVE
jgi:hypothetical protein